MDLGLIGRTALITGASKGIGEGAARAFAAEGCKLVLFARDSAKLAAAAARLRLEFNIVVQVLALDRTEDGALERLAAIEAVDMLVNNAGAIPGGDLQKVGASAWRHAWNLTIYGYIDICRIFYARMKSHGGGVIINNIGASAKFFDPNYIAGSSGNAVLVAFTRALGARSSDDAIRVVGVSPGPVATERIEKRIRDRGSPATSPPPFPLGGPRR